jgi:VWFA-related protein
MVTAPLGWPSSRLPRTVWFTFLGGILLFAGLPVARAQAPSASPQAAQAPPADTSQNAPKQDAKAPNDEIVSHDSPATFKVRVNVVLVRVVVRDNNGKVVTNLKKEDFQLADQRKPQIISSFSVETPASHAPSVGPGEATSEGTPVNAADLPQRFVTLFFDDLHLSLQDAMFSRQATAKLFAAMGARDRLSIFTTSGQVEQDFTEDRGKLEEAVQRILPHSLTQKSAADCPPMTLYEAHVILDERDASAIQVANQDLMNCSGNPPIPGPTPTEPGPIVAAVASMVLNLAEAEEQRTYQTLEALIRRMSVLPGQRVIVMMSPGFFVLPSMHMPEGEVIDRATKENVVINTIDARGLYVSSVYDASSSGTAVPSISPLKTQYAMREEETHFAPLADLADGTGGVYFHDRNDIDQGLLNAAAEPDVSYVLGFTPQNLKLDGKYHTLKVTLTSKQKWGLQARHGYFAPRGESNSESAAKEEIQQAVFSQEEMRELPIECQAQFFKGADGVHLSVVTHVGTEELKFRKVDGRNQDTLTITTGIFDQNGNMLAGLQRVLDMRLKDVTLERVNKTGLNVKLSFDLQPGTFLVRTVVRDSEGAQMGAANREVVIP